MSRKKATIPKVPVPKTQYITKEYSLSVRDTFIACIPALIGTFIMLGLIWLGWQAIYTIKSVELQGFALVMYLVVLVPKMINLIPMPITTWRVETREEQ